jgi:DnaJ-class molecular chaperone
MQANTKTHYQVLDIPTNATLHDIKAAYRRQLLSNHPDKSKNVCGNDDITAIVNAYKTLRDPKTRKQYDESMNQQGTSHAFNEAFFTIFVFFANQIKNIVDTTPSYTKIDKKPPPIELDLNVSLLDVYNGKVKKMVVTVQREIQGTYIAQTQTLLISLCGYQPVIYFENVGDQSPNYTKHGDIVVSIHVNTLQNTRLDGYDIFVERRATLHDFYIDPIQPYTFLNVELTTNKTKSCQVFHNMGLPYDIDLNGEYVRGNLYILHKVIIPRHTEALIYDNKFADFLKIYFGYSTNESADMPVEYQ